MPARPTPPWLNRTLFWSALAAAGLLAGLVALTPLSERAGWGAAVGRPLALFAHDGGLRRTALACAVGLAATASVFFRTPGRKRPTPTAAKPPAPPPRVVGA